VCGIIRKCNVEISLTCAINVIKEKLSEIVGQTGSNINRSLTDQGLCNCGKLVKRAVQLGRYIGGWLQ
jgi:hypothetical protein